MTFKSNKQRKYVMSKIKSGDYVYYKNDPTRTKYQVYAVYNKNEVSLGLEDYPDVEQDNLTNKKDIIKIKKK
jgi:hypothetical protein